MAAITTTPATVITTPQTTPAAGAPLPRLWARFSVRTGTLVQAAGIAAGAAALGAGAHLHAAGGFRLALLATGWLAIYLSSHAIAHVAVGRGAALPAATNCATPPPDGPWSTSR